LILIVLTVLDNYSVAMTRRNLSLKHVAVRLFVLFNPYPTNVENRVSS